MDSLLTIALVNPIQEKLASDAEAKATPPTMETKQRMTEIEGESPRNKDDKTTEKNGSIALIVCVKLTATDPREMLVSRLPRVWTTARGMTALTVSLVTFGLFMTPVVHSIRAMTDPTMNCKTVSVRGKGKAWRTCLL